MGDGDFHVDASLAKYSRFPSEAILNCQPVAVSWRLKHYTCTKASRLDGRCVWRVTLEYEQHETNWRNIIVRGVSNRLFGSLRGGDGRRHDQWLAYLSLSADGAG